MKNNIILIGFMGSGKSTLGRWIRDNRSMQLLDTDEYIEQKQKRKISKIFAEDGEAVFRAMETDTIHELIQTTDHAVISVGGGLPVREENRKLLKELGTVVYLEASEDELVRRLTGDQSRPLLAGTDLRVRIQELMQARKELYLDAADLIVSTEHKTFAEMYEQILSFMDTKES